MFPGPHHLRPVDLAARVGLSKQALNPLLNELKEMGYLHRVADDRDRRARILQLTARGMALMATLRAILDDLEQHLTDRVSTADIDTFDRVLREVRVVAENPAAASNRTDRPARPLMPSQRVSPGGNLALPPEGELTLRIVDSRPNFSGGSSVGSTDVRAVQRRVRQRRCGVLRARAERGAGSARRWVPRSLDPAQEWGRTGRVR